MDTKEDEELMGDDLDSLLDCFPSELEEVGSGSASCLN